MANIGQIIVSVIIFIVAFVFIKKLAGCLVRIVLLLLVAAVLAWLYFDMNKGTFDAFLSILK